MFHADALDHPETMTITMDGITFTFGIVWEDPPRCTFQSAQSGGITIEIPKLYRGSFAGVATTHLRNALARDAAAARGGTR